MTHMAGPKKIVELPSSPSKWVSLQQGAHHLYDGKLWIWVPAGCVCCVESSKASDQTLQSVDDSELLVCPNHGELEKVLYVSEHQYVLQLGDRKVTGSRRTEDFFLFPKGQSPEERASLIEKILAEADDYEETHDPIMGDE